MEQIRNISDTVKFPELVFGIAGAVGIDIDEIVRTLSDTLKAVGYHALNIRITDVISREPTNQPVQRFTNLEEEITSKMDHANAVCKKYQSSDALMRFAIRAIQSSRAAAARVTGKSEELPAEKIQPRTAYIIRQLKRPQEVDLLRSVYGEQFVLVSAYGSIPDRKRLLETALKRSLPLNTPDVDIACKADALMHRDQEEDDLFGQNLRDTFHRADVFVDGISKSAMSTMMVRFIDALFGRADIAPSKNEYGMYAAKSASLRSSDLSRQIGAAIFSADGELISQG